MSVKMSVKRIMKKIIIKNKDTEIIIPDGEEVILIDKIASTKKAAKKLLLSIGKNCLVQYVSILASNIELAAEGQRELIIGVNSRVNYYGAYFGAGLSRLNFTAHIGPEAEFNSRVFFYQAGAEVLEATDNYIFSAPNSRGRFSVTGLLSGTASTKYYSDIIIKPVAQGTDSRIDMKLYLLDAGTKGVILPSLKIAANEVKAGHGASTFQLSPEDLFYLASRGLSQAQAKALVIKSLANQFIDGLASEEAQKLILKEIAKKELLVLPKI